ncbi:hypothetical protein D3C80_578390 [compost metagenome]
MRATVQRGITQHLSICADDTAGVVIKGRILGFCTVFQCLRGVTGENGIGCFTAAVG